MPENKWKCSNEVKAAFLHKHTVCSKRKCGMKPKSGYALNKYLFNANLDHNTKFEDGRMYNVCDTLNKLFNNGSIPKRGRMKKNSSLLEVKVDDEKSICVDPGHHTGTSTSTRHNRALRRHRLTHDCINDNDLKRIKRVKVKVGDKVLKDDINFRYMRKGKNDSLFDDISSISSKYKLSYRKLEFRTKMSRIDEVSKLIIAMCIDRTQFKSEGLSYLEDNDILANDTLNIVHGIKERLELMLKFDMNSIKHPEPSIEESIDSNKDIESVSKHLDVGVNVLKETTGRGYDRICKDMKKIDVHLPSNYKINKQLPAKVESVSYMFSKSELTKVKEADIKEAILGEVVVKHENEILDFVSTDFVSPDFVLPDFQQQHLQSTNSNEHNVNSEDNHNMNLAWGAKLHSSFKDTVTMMFNQHKNKKKRFLNTTR
jgi:hypothetical protein